RRTSAAFLGLPAVALDLPAVAVAGKWFRLGLAPALVRLDAAALVGRRALLVGGAFDALALVVAVRPRVSALGPRGLKIAGWLPVVARVMGARIVIDRNVVVGVLTHDVSLAVAHVGTAIAFLLLVVRQRRIRLLQPESADRIDARTRVAERIGAAVA